MKIIFMNLPPYIFRIFIIPDTDRILLLRLCKCFIYKTVTWEINAIKKDSYFVFFLIFRGLVNSPKPYPSFPSKEIRYMPSS